MQSHFPDAFWHHAHSQEKISGAGVIRENHSGPLCRIIYFLTNLFSACRYGRNSIYGKCTCNSKISTQLVQIHVHRLENEKNDFSNPYRSMSTGWKTRRMTSPTRTDPCPQVGFGFSNTYRSIFLRVYIIGYSIACRYGRNPETENTTV